MVNFLPHILLALLALLAAPVLAGPLERVQSRADFPRVRQSVTYQTMDWERDELVTKTRSVTDSEPLLAPRRVAALTPPRGELVTPAIPPHTVASSLANVTNLKDFGRFTPRQENLLTRYGFTVTAETRPQMFQLYEENVYWNIPNFVTTDVILHTWSDLYGYLLRKVERRIVFGWVKILSASMRAESLRQHGAARDPRVKAAALRNAAFFAVPEAILSRTLKNVPPARRAEVMESVDAIKAAAETRDCFMGRVDFTEFKPRGHYTASEDLANFFRAMTWYGRIARGVPPAGQDAISNEMLEALLMADALRTGRTRGVTLLAAWDRAHDITALFSGPSNTITPVQILDLSRAAFGLTPKPDDFADSTRHAAFLAALRRLPSARIVRDVDGETRTHQVTFMGKRYVLDAEILQRLVRFPDKPFGEAIDVFSALGFDRARAVQDSNGLATSPAWFAGSRAEVARTVDEIPEELWTRNAYWGNLWTLQALQAGCAEGYPFFMQSDGWADKSLNTAAGSWAELRHNTILYSEAFSAEGGGEQYVIDFPKGTIEPNELFFARMRWLVAKLRADLGTRGCLTARMAEKTRMLEEICDSSLRIVRKELRNERLTRADHEFIHFLGNRFAQITTGCLLNDAFNEDYDREEMWRFLPESDRNMAVIADIGQSSGVVQEVGVGPAHAVFVVFPTPAGLRLGRGAVYQYYSFLQPAATRLTDAEWRARLNSENRPEIPNWTQSYRALDRHPGPLGFSTRSEVDWLDYRYVPD